MKKIQKIMSVVVVFTLITSQIGCAGKVTKISAPLDQVKFEKDYKYTVKLKTGEKTQVVTSDHIYGNPNELVIQTPTKSQTLMSQDIERIDGIGRKRTGSYAGRGFLIGAGGGLIAGLGTSIAISASNCTTEPDDAFGCHDWDILGYILLTPFLTLAGGGLGAIIGAFIPAHHKIQITPIIEPTSSGIRTGANLQVNF